MSRKKNKILILKRLKQNLIKAYNDFIKCGSNIGIEKQFLIYYHSLEIIENLEIIYLKNEWSELALSDEEFMAYKDLLRLRIKNSKRILRYLDGRFEKLTMQKFLNELKRQSGLQMTEHLIDFLNQNNYNISTVICENKFTKELAHKAGINWKEFGVAEKIYNFLHDHVSGNIQKDREILVNNALIEMIAQEFSSSSEDAEKIDKKGIEGLISDILLYQIYLNNLKDNELDFLKQQMNIAFTL